MFTAFATALSIEFRNNPSFPDGGFAPGPDNVPKRYAGTPLADIIFVKVNWPWLALPLTLVLLGNIFVVYAIVDNYFKKVVLWKGNPLALMFHGLDTNVLNYAGAPHTDAEMRQRAGAVTVQLQHTDHGIKLAHS